MSYVKRIAPLAAAALFVYCLLISEQLAESSRLYLELCGRQVVPSLFVFSVLGGLVSQGSGINLLCKILPRWGTETAVGALGLCGGVPLGSVTALKLYRDGDISKRQAEYLCTFSCTPSLSFIVSFAGGVLGGSSGVILAILTVAAEVVTALVFKPIMLPKGERKLVTNGSSASKPFSAVLADSALSAVIICGCVVFFGSMATLLPGSLGGFLEISTGIHACGSLAEAATLLGFSGLSILLQTAAVCEGEINLFPCFAAKVFQAIFMGGVAFFVD